MKISGKVYMHIMYTFIWCKPQWPLHNSLNPRLELLAGMNEKPPCQGQSLYLRSWVWGRPGSYEGIYWPFYQLRTTWNNLKGCNLLSWEATFLHPVVHQVGLQLVLVVHDNGDILMVRTQLSAILAVCLFILFKNLSHQRKKLFGLD
jgi:hypothetical protein